MTDPVPLRRRDPDFCPRDGTPMADMERRGEPVRMCPVCGFWQGPDPLVMLGLWVERDGQVLLVRRGDIWTLPLYHMHEAADPVAVLHDAFRRETGLEISLSTIADVFNIPDQHLGEVLLFLYTSTIATGPTTDVAFYSPANLAALTSDSATATIAQRIHVPQTR